ncbi:hypothetical protein IU414_06520 [Nocardia farcinica]|uniref:hypothetical protein n=1 Tax=Nocardia farcinica TaxID=37329 RepID=UPI0018938DF5|nr:hypothetical protein [Nocardia farcinica]MBF6584413.1 hypothetical protein [Nocardia farcinica]
MTVIAAVATSDRVVMACDTRYDYSGTGMYGAPKIRSLAAPNGDTILLAASGNASLLPVVLRSVKPQGTPDPADTASCDDWANAMAEAITGALNDATPSLIASADGNGAAAIYGTLAIAWRQHLWWVYSHTATRPHPGVLAIGSGTDVALGSLHTSIPLGVNPEKAVDLAVRLACRHADGCGIDDRGPLIYATQD